MSVSAIELALGYAIASSRYGFSRLAMAYSASCKARRLTTLHRLPAPVPFLRNFSNGWTGRLWLEATRGRYA